MPCEIVMVKHTWNHSYELIPKVIVMIPNYEQYNNERNKAMTYRTKFKESLPYPPYPPYPPIPYPPIPPIPYCAATVVIVARRESRVDRIVPIARTVMILSHLFPFSCSTWQSLCSSTSRFELNRKGRDNRRKQESAIALPTKDNAK